MTVSGVPNPEDSSVFILPREEWLLALIFDAYVSASFALKNYYESRDPKFLKKLKANLILLAKVLYPIAEDYFLKSDILFSLAEMPDSVKDEEAIKGFDKITKLLHRLGLFKVEKRIEQPDEVYDSELRDVYGVE